MNRRTLLAVAGSTGASAAAGCLGFGFGVGSDDSDDHIDPNGETDPNGDTEDPEPPWRIVEAEEPTEIAADLTKTARIVLEESEEFIATISDPGSESTPPRLKIGRRNTRVVEDTVELPRDGLLTNHNVYPEAPIDDLLFDLDGDEPAFHFVPARQGEDAVYREGDCWRRFDSVEHGLARETVELDNDEMVVQEYFLVVADGLECYRPGDYELRNPTQAGTMSFIIWDPTSEEALRHSRFAGATVPPLKVTDADENGPTWFHERSRRDVILEPAKEIVQQPWADIEFTLHNYTDETLELSINTELVFKLVDGQWYEITRGRNGLGVLINPQLHPGESRSRTLQYDNRDPNQLSLGAGRYGILTYSPRAAALFEVLGDPLTLQPTEFVDSIEREPAPDGRVITIMTDHPDVEDDLKNFIVLESIDPTTISADPVRMIPEQADTSEALRTILSFATDPEVTSVELESPPLRQTGPIATLLEQQEDDGSFRGTFEFQGDYFELRAPEEAFQPDLHPLSE